LNLHEGGPNHGIHIFAEHLGQRFDGRVFEKTDNRNAPAEFLPERRHQLNGEQ